MLIRSFTILLLGILFFTGCSSKEHSSQIYNKPGSYWYKRILKSIAMGNLDKADDAYSSLASEHVASPYLKEALMILFNAHLEEEEYLMANFYLDSYTKKFATRRNIEYLKYLKIKSGFKEFKHPKRNQKLLIDTIAEAKEYLQKFPNSIYNPMVETILTKLYLTELILNRDIASLYKRLGKNKAAQIYMEKVNSSWLKDTPIATSESSLFEKILQ